MTNEVNFLTVRASHRAKRSSRSIPMSKRCSGRPCWDGTAPQLPYALDMEHLDVLVVGAGISGISAAYHLQTHCPDKTYAIVDMRDNLGGTWDLFRYPGIRSDSDMYTLGFRWKAWENAKAIADGPSILEYLKRTASEYGIDRKVRHGIKVKAARWRSDWARWVVDCEEVASGKQLKLSCNFLFMCTGYYEYEHGYTPHFEGRDRFRGTIVHPQHWPRDLDYDGKRVVVIGSGATAMTLVPAMMDAANGQRAAHVTMLQRTPTYVVSMPAEDKHANWLREHLPSMTAYGLTRWKNILWSTLSYNYTRRFPDRAKTFIMRGVRRHLPDFDIKKHFNPPYNVWDQRVCLVPDADLFKAIKRGDVDVVTDHIATFTERGVKLESGDELEADIIVTATGLQLKVMAGLELEVDGKLLNKSDLMSYKGMMYSDVPNLAQAFGYTNASWTLKCDLTCEFVTRLINHMDKNGFDTVTPARDPDVDVEESMPLAAGYIQRSVHLFPKQGKTHPWRLYQNYFLDMLSLRYSPLRDGTLKFSKSKGVRLRVTQPAAIQA